jgi:hypothetical protein
MQKPPSSRQTALDFHRYISVSVRSIILVIPQETDPEPLPLEHPLRKMVNVIISPHVGGQSPGVRNRQWRLIRENMRRFVAGEPMLCVVDKEKGY